MSGNVSLAIRGYQGKYLVWHTAASMPAAYFERIIPQLAEEHAESMAIGEITMIELEFLEERNSGKRFFRFSIDPDGIVKPV
jgi:hypothetical protein